MSRAEPAPARTTSGSAAGKSSAQKGRKKNSKASKKMGKKAARPDKDIQLQEELAERAWPEIDKNKAVFFVVHLHPEDEEVRVLAAS